MLILSSTARASDKSCWEYQAVETILKGKEIPLPSGYEFKDQYGTPRLDIRIRWWDQQATTYKEIFMGSPDWATHIPDDEIKGDHLTEYGLGQPPVFLVHYWLAGKPAPMEQHVACLDYSVARPGGQLVAYRWNGENELCEYAFVSVERVENSPQSNLINSLSLGVSGEVRDGRNVQSRVSRPCGGDTLEFYSQ